MEIEELCGQIYRYFLLRNFKWRKNGELIFPSMEDIEEMIMSCIQAISESKDDISIEVGSLLVKKNEGKIDVYMYVGEIDASNNV